MATEYAATDRQVSYIESLILARDVDANDESMMRDCINKGITAKVASSMIQDLLSRPFRARAQFGAAHENGIKEDGMYQMPNGAIYKVQYNKAQGDGRRLYAKLLVLVNNEDGTYKVHFDYVKGVVYQLTPAMKMTLEQAKEFGALYGTCCNCGRTLTNEESIELGIGPICRAKFA